MPWWPTAVGIGVLVWFLNRNDQQFAALYVSNNRQVITKHVSTTRPRFSHGRPSHALPHLFGRAFLRDTDNGRYPPRHR